MFFFAITGSVTTPVQLRQRILDEALIIRIGRGDIQALTQLYESTELTIYAYILSIIQNPADTVDIVQETYLYVRRSAHLYIPTGNPLAWLLSIARNLTNDYLRINKRFHLKAGDLETDPIFDNIPVIADKIILKHALGTLRAEERQVLFLHAVAGLRHREIAANISIPISSVLTRFNRAVNKLKKHLSVLGVSL